MKDIPSLPEASQPLPFSDPASVARYADRTTRAVPGLHDMHTMASVLLAEHVPADARLLILGAGGGMELDAFARRHPCWQFDGVDPSAEMLQLARTALGPLASRVRFHEGYIDTAPKGPFDAATCLLTLHFLSMPERQTTLAHLHQRLRPGAPLIVAHHSFPHGGADHDRWLARYAAYTTATGTPSAQARESIPVMRAKLPVLSPEEDVALLQDAGFSDVELFYCGLTFKGWIAVRH